MKKMGARVALLFTSYLLTSWACQSQKNRLDNESINTRKTVEQEFISTHYLLVHEEEYLEIIFCTQTPRSCGQKYSTLDNTEIPLTASYDVVFVRSCIANRGCYEWYWQYVSHFDPHASEWSKPEAIIAQSHKLDKAESLQLKEEKTEEKSFSPAEWLATLESRDGDLVIAGGAAGSAILGGIVAVPTYPLVKGSVRYTSYFAYKWHLGGGSKEYTRMKTREDALNKVQVQDTDRWITAWDWDKTLTQNFTLPFLEKTFRLKDEALKTLSDLINENIDVVVVSQNNSKKMPAYLRKQLLGLGKDNSEWKDKVRRYFTVLQPNVAGMGNKDEMLREFLRKRILDDDMKGKKIRVLGFDDNPQQLVDIVNAVDEPLSEKNVEIMGYHVGSKSTFTGHFKFVKDRVDKSNTSISFRNRAIIKP